MKSYKNTIANHKHLMQRARLYNWTLGKCYLEHQKLIKDELVIITDQQMIEEMEDNEN